MTRTIIAGTRTLSSYVVAHEAILCCPWVNDITEVVSGAHPSHVERFRLGLRQGNPDIFGAVWAGHRNIPVKFFPADWNRLGNAAGPLRNGEMAWYGDSLILIWTGNPRTSKGSANMLQRAKMAGYPAERIFQHLIDE